MLYEYVDVYVAINKSCIQKRFNSQEKGNKWEGDGGDPNSQSNGKNDSCMCRYSKHVKFEDAGECAQPQIVAV